jgi:putative transposase
MPRNLKRIVGNHDLHFITFCCYHRRAHLGTASARNQAVHILGEVRNEHGFALIGYVLMPNHVHLLVNELPNFPPAYAVQIFKQRVSQCLAKSEDTQGPNQFWQRRYYDFNVYTTTKLKEKLHYMHLNPVRAKLVPQPRDWPWSSWSHYYSGHSLLPMDSFPVAATKLCSLA